MKDWSIDQRLHLLQIARVELLRRERREQYDLIRRSRPIRPRASPRSAALRLKPGKPLSNMAMLSLLKDMNYDESGQPRWTDPKSGRSITPHGLRATFRTWGEDAGFPRISSKNHWATKLGLRWNEPIGAPTASIGDVRSCRLGPISAVASLLAAAVSTRHQGSNISHEPSVGQQFGRANAAGASAGASVTVTVSFSNTYQFSPNYSIIITKPSRQHLRQQQVSDRL